VEPGIYSTYSFREEKEKCITKTITTTKATKTTTTTTTQQQQQQHHSCYKNTEHML